MSLDGFIISQGGGEPSKLVSLGEQYSGGCAIEESETSLDSTSSVIILIMLQCNAIFQFLLGNIYFLLFISVHGAHLQKTKETNFS